MKKVIFSSIIILSVLAAALYFGDVPEPDLTALLPEPTHVPDDRNAWIPLKQALELSETVFRNGQSVEAERSFYYDGFISSMGFDAEYNRFKTRFSQDAATLHAPLLDLIEQSLECPEGPFLAQTEDSWEALNRLNNYRTAAVLMYGATDDPETWIPRLRFSRRLLDAHSECAMGVTALVLLETAQLVAEYPDYAPLVLDELFRFPRPEEVYAHNVRSSVASQVRYIKGLHAFMRHILRRRGAFKVVDEKTTRWTMPWVFKRNLTLREIAKTGHARLASYPLPYVQYTQNRADPKERDSSWLGCNRFGLKAASAYRTTRIFADVVASWQGAVLTAALAEYQNQTGKFPDTLTALVPDILGELPLDPFEETSWVLSPAKNAVHIAFEPVIEQFSMPAVRVK